jgi:tungstate transport system permease protein
VAFSASSGKLKCVLTTAIVMEAGKGDFGLAIALSVILMIIVYLVNLILTIIQQRGKAR